MNTATLISDKKKHFDMTIAENVLIEKSENMFSVTNINGKKRKYKQPDEDFYRAISMDELRVRTHKVIDDFFDKK